MAEGEIAGEPEENVEADGEEPEYAELFEDRRIGGTNRLEEDGGEKHDGGEAEEHYPVLSGKIAEH